MAAYSHHSVTLEMEPRRRDHGRAVPATSSQGWRATSPVTYSLVSPGESQRGVYGRHPDTPTECRLEGLMPPGRGHRGNLGESVLAESGVSRVSDRHVRYYECDGY